MNRADYEVIKWYNEWAYELRNRIREGEAVDWENVGVLKKTSMERLYLNLPAPYPICNNRRLPTA